MLVFDIETDGLLDELTKVHCVNMVDRSTGERLRFNDQPLVVTRPPDGTLKEGLRRLEEAEIIGGHNVINFDVPAIRKVYPSFRPRGKVVDSLVYSRIIWTNIRDIDNRAIKRRRRPPEFEELKLAGKHSLEAWGYRLGNYKGDFKGPWDTFTPVMDDYCAQDVEVNVTLFEKIEAEGYSQWALDIETRVAEIVDLQEKHGILFDVEAAEKLAVQMTGEMAELEDQLRVAFPPWIEPVRYKGKPVVVTAKRRTKVRRWHEDGTEYFVEFAKGETYEKFKLVSFEPGSRDKIANRLTALFGWRPQEFTEGGKPKVDETTLDGLEYPEAKLLKDYLTLAKRLGFLATGDSALLKKVGPDGRIHGRVNSNGAVTGRMTHFSPNLAQVPKVKVDRDGSPILGLAGGYGYELRSLFIVPKGKKLVGVDAEGLELRMLAHYMARYDDGAYVHNVVEGNKADASDAHSVNRDVVGLNSRDNAKTWIYAYLYGAGNWKLGFITYEDLGDNHRAMFASNHSAGDAREGALSQLGLRGRRKIEGGLPALGKLQEKVKATARTGSLRGLDGRKLHVRGLHSALNTLLQGGGAIVMKLALVLAYEEFLERGWVHGREFAFVVNVHDEFQIEADENIAQEIGSIAADAIRKAGEAFGLRCPLAGSCDIGDRWSATH
jgi:DNA polymerase I-like protein with 3'-5' exonuclease and polymerase domains